MSLNTSLNEPTPVPLIGPIQHVVIVGAGQAGYQTAASLRQEGFAGDITLIGDEPGLPYQRPPLSKAYLLGKIGSTSLRFRQPEFYEQNRITLLNDQVTAIERTQRHVKLSTGGTLAYDHLVLATGARNRVPVVPGTELDGVFGLRMLTDADALAARMAEVKHVVVIGAGFIGLEFAAVAAAKGLAVHVLEMGQRVMARAVSPQTSELFRTAHQAWGTQLDFGHSVARIVGDANGRVSGVETEDGRLLPAELVVYGIGVVPNTELAAAAGLDVHNGISVNALLLTEDSNISAIGDVVSFVSPYCPRPIRLESVQNAADQARTVAARLMGKPAAFTALPWFWTDQGDLKLQIAGLLEGHDEVVQLGSAAAKQVSVLCFRQGRLIAVETINRTPDHMAARKLLARATPLTPAEASAPEFDLKAYELASRETA
jgi:3-phenylpropionate/trans-cinnamate dioxygenase ferredoxin reductase subunit